MIVIAQWQAEKSNLNVKKGWGGVTFENRHLLIMQEPAFHRKYTLRVDNKSAILFFNTYLDETILGYKIKYMWGI